MNAPVELGSRRELMVDDFLIERIQGAVQFRLHTPQPREIVLHTDAPWEGNMSGMVTVLRDPSTRRFRMYYRNGAYFHIANQNHAHLTDICLCESDDGIHWNRTLSSRFPHENQPTNIVLTGQGPLSIGTVSYFPFFDENPKSPRFEGYKAISSDNARPPSGLYLLTSYDGMHWTLKTPQPFFTTALSQRMRFDSVNVLFWDPNIQLYRLYYRDYDANHVRCIRMSTSADLITWSDPTWLDYGPDAPVAQLYTNNIQPYHRAPHVYVGFPMRYVERAWSPTMEQLPELEHRRFRVEHGVGPRSGTALTDGLFMCSRDGNRFKRFDEAFFRPTQPVQGNWAYGDNQPAHGILETEPTEPGGHRELSLFTVENYWRASRIRRHTLRLDGFVSLQAAYSGGVLTTRLFTFTGSRLTLNLATSAAGNLRVELQDESGQPLPGYSFDDCCEIVGDKLDYVVHWKHGASVESLSGKPIRMSIRLHDADLYALQFVS